MNEQKWTTHRVTMPDDKALEYLDKLLVVVNKQFLDPGFPIALSMAIDRMRAPLPDNKALTCEGCVSFGDDQDRTPCFGCKRAVREVDCYRCLPEKGE